MTKSTRSIISMVAILGIITFPALAAPTNAELLATLETQLAQLKAQIDALIQAQANLRTTQQQVQGTLGLIRNLREGMTGDDVKKLQELLAQDITIYPEGRITGFFGKLTAKAIKKFQARHGLDQVGFVGPKTLRKLNEQFGRHDSEDNEDHEDSEGDDHEGKPCAKIPPGHLIAPGYLKKHEDEDKPTIPPCQILPPGIAKKLDREHGSTTPDTTVPIISNVAVSGITQTSAIVMWTTNEAANSQVRYGTTTSYGLATAFNASLVTSHSQTVTGLMANTTYHYKVMSKDAAGNTATSSDALFTTALTLDTTPPVLSLITASGTTATTTKITWTTDEPSTSKVWYSNTLPLLITPATGKAGSMDLLQSHVISLGGLNASTTYYYLVVSGDASQNIATSTVFLFPTL